jgi:hypothetical protein
VMFLPMLQCSSLCLAVPFCVSLRSSSPCFDFFSMFRYSFSCFFVPFYASLHYSSLCFVVPCVSLFLLLH